MSHTDREDGDGSGRVSEQDILKIFDNSDDPILTSSEIADELPVSRQAVNYRLKQMHEEGLVDRKETGARAVAWWATRTPAPSDDTLRDIEATEGELERGKTVGLTDMKRRLGMDG